MLVPDDTSYDPDVHLSFRDIAIDDLKNRSVLWVTIKQSKTDPNLCPVLSMLSYLELRGGKPGLLFLFQNRKPLTRPCFVDAVKDALKKTGLDKEKYCSHSFQIGAATTAASKGMEDCIIKTLGRWESVVYLQYI